MSGNKKPVLLFINHWAQRPGGAEYSLMDIMFFAQERFDCHLATSERGLLTEKASAMNVTSHVIPCNPSLGNIRRWNFLHTVLFSWFSIPSFIVFALRLKRLIRRLKPALIHANVPKSHIALFLLVKSGYAGRCCFHIREIFEDGSFPKFIYARLFPRKNSVAVAISSAVKNNLPVRIQSKATVLYNGISIPDRTKNYSDGKSIKLMYLGRIVPWKGCHILIDILSLAIKEYPSTGITLSLIGDTIYWPSAYRDELDRKISVLHLQSHCQILSHTDEPERHFVSHDIFCNASYNEPFGRSVAEASAHGLPVIAFDGGGIPEIVKNNESGFLVPYNDREGFIKSIGKFIADPGSIEKMGRRAREFAQNSFDRKKQAPLLCDFLYNQICLKHDK